MHFNSSQSNQIGLGFQNNSIDHGQMFSQQSNFGLNNRVQQGGGLFSSHQLMGGTNNANNPSIGLHQNLEFTSHVNQPSAPGLGQLGLGQNEMVLQVNRPSTNSLGQLGHGQLGLGQHEMISHVNQPSTNSLGLLGFGRLGLCPTVTEVRRTYVTPQRVQVHSVVDYFPVQNQAPVVQQSEMSITEYRTTQLLTTNSTRDRFFSPPNPNDQIHIQGQQPNSFQSLNRLPMSNQQQVNHPLITERDPQGNHFRNPFQYQHPSYYQSHSQKFNQYQNPSYNNPSLMQNQPVFGSNVQNQFYNPSYNFQNQPRKATLQLIEEDEHSDHKGKVKEVLDAEPLNSYVPNTMDQDPKENQPPNHTIPQNQSVDTTNAASDDSDDGDDNETEDDGRIHSLPCKKYGPYTCPKCKSVFNTSQLFAAHVGTHYKDESRAEKRKRQIAKYRRKNLRLVQVGDALTVVPVSFDSPPRKNRHKQKNVSKKAKKDSEEVEDEDAKVDSGEDEEKDATMASKEVEEKDKAEMQEQAALPALPDKKGIIAVVKDEPLELMD